MFQFAAVLFVCLACASTTPLDSKVEGFTDNGKKNVTEKANDEKSVPPYTVGDYYNQKPVFYPMSAGNKPIFSNPMVRQPTSWPAYQVLNAKTFLRPQMYQGQSQLYSYPYQSSIQPYSYGSPVQSYPIQSYQSYPQSAYAYSSYQPSTQSYYGSYYKQAKEQEPAPMHSTPARILVEKPVGQPVDQVPMASPMGVPMAMPMGVPMAMPMGFPAGPDQQVSNVIPRDASTNWIPYTVLPQDNSGPMDNMPIQPSYFIDRQQLQSPSARSAEDFSLPEYGPSTGSGDEVYYVMNKYDQQPLVAKATDDVFQSNSMWMAAPVPAAFHDNKPYSPESIFGNMAQFYANKYQEQLSMANQNLPRTAKSSYTNTDKFMEKLIDELTKRAEAKKTEGPVKAEEKKETSTAPPKANA